MATIINKWAAGPNYGPVLEPTDLYLLQTELELHPVLKGQAIPSFVFNIATGNTATFNAADREHDLPFEKHNEPATLPRVTELIIITKLSPWFTHVRNESGITIQDVCGKLWTDYGETVMTETEFKSVPPRLQEQMKRNQLGHQGGPGWPYATPPSGAVMTFRRSDYLRNMIYFDRLEKEDTYCKQRLGFTAPNVFVLHLTS